MANITAADVNKLRQMTGAGMMDCKQALVESDGDFEKAIDNLRKKGQKLATKRADREANEGYVLAKINSANTYAAVIMLNCETDFVAKNEDFIGFAYKVLDLCIAEQPKSLDELNGLSLNGRSVSDSLTDLVGKIGEKLALAHYEFIEAPTVAAYNHHGNRLATILGLNLAGIEGVEQVAREIGMQIAAMNPVAIDKDNVSAETIEREIEIGKEQARQEGKPEEMLEKIAMGKLNKFYKENTLLNQEFIKDNNLTVKQYLSQLNKELTVTSFRRLALGA
jgi:elongation factor Ts